MNYRDGLIDGCRPYRHPQTGEEVCFATFRYDLTPYYGPYQHVHCTTTCDRPSHRGPRDAISDSNTMFPLQQPEWWY